MSADRLLVAARVAEEVRERIIAGEFRPGDPLREERVAERHGGSRNTVREAFRLLARDGLVVHHPHRGVRVRTLQRADITDMYLVRRAVEPLGLSLVDAQVLRRIVDAAFEAARADDWGTVATDDLRFHRAVVSAIGSPRIDASFSVILAELRIAFTMVPDARAFHEPFLHRNASLVGYVELADLQAAGAELSSYLDTAEAELSRVV